jgi:hypothetical protein
MPFSASPACERDRICACDAGARAQNFLRDGIVAAPVGATIFFSQETAQAGRQRAESIKKRRIGTG